MINLIIFAISSLMVHNAITVGYVPPAEYNKKQKVIKNYTHKITIESDSVVYMDLYKAIEKDIVKEKTNGDFTIFYVKLDKHTASLVNKASFDNYKVEMD